VSFGWRGLARVLVASALGIGAFHEGCDPRLAARSSLALEQPSLDGGARAVVRDHPQRPGQPQSLWVGPAGGALAKVVELARDEGRCDRAEWAAEGVRVAFLIGHRRVVVADREGGRVVFDRALVEGEGPPRVVTAIALTADGGRLQFVTCLEAGGGCTDIEQIDLATGQELRRSG
jgi:hypothetical protein